MLNHDEGCRILGSNAGLKPSWFEAVLWLLLLFVMIVSLRWFVDKDGW